MLLWQQKEPVPERYRLWPHEKGLVLMIKPELAELGDAPFWQSSKDRIERWKKDNGLVEPTISEWESIKDPFRWGFGGVGTLGGFDPSDDPKREWIPFLFAYYPVKDRAGRQRALDISATLTHVLYWLNGNGLKDPEGDPGAQLMLVQTITDPRGYNLMVDVSVGFRHWISSCSDVALLSKTVEEAATKAHNLLLPSVAIKHALTFLLGFSGFLFQGERFALNPDHLGGDDMGMTLDSVEVDTPVLQLILLRALAALWAIYYRRS